MTKLWQWLAPPGETRLRPRAYFFIAFVALALHLPGQVGIPAMDRDEARYAQATKQMIASGDFVDIRFGDEVRYLQPAGIYWLQSLAAMPFGGASAPIWAFRLPSLLAALSAVLLTAWFGARLAGPALGTCAGLILAPSLLLTAEAHFAKIDSTLLIATLAAQATLYLTIARNEEAPQHFIGWPLVFWLAIGVGVMLKGPIIVLVVGFTIIAYGLWQRQWRFLRDLRPLVGVPIVIAVAAPWLIAITVKSGGLFWKEAVGRSFAYKIAHGQQAHGQPPGYHTLIFMLTFFPGVVLAGLGGLYAWRHRGERLVRFLLCWIIPTWVMFELVTTKLPHYTLPVFPALALLAALGLNEAPALLEARAARWWHRLALLLFLIAGVAVAAIPIAAAQNLSEPLSFAIYVATGFAISIVATGIFLWWRPRPSRLLPFMAMTALTYIAIFQFVIPSFDRLWVSDRLARVVNSLEGCAHRSVAVAGYSEPSLVFNFGANTLLGSGAAAESFLAHHPVCGVAAVDESAHQDFLAAAGAHNLDLVKDGAVQGINYVNGHKMDITVYVPASSALTLPAGPGD